MAKMIAQQEATPAYEEPVLLSSEIEEQTKRLDREILYLLNKLRSHRPPKAKNATANATNSSTASNTTTSKVSRNLANSLLRGVLCKFFYSEIVCYNLFV